MPRLQTSVASAPKLDRWLSSPRTRLLSSPRRRLRDDVSPIAFTKQRQEAVEFLGRRKSFRQHKATQRTDARTQKGSLEFDQVLGTFPNHGQQKTHPTPYELSQSVREYCNEGQFPKAVTIVKGALWDAQNAILWNTLIKEAMKIGKYKEAYRLFTDMKRRGFMPTSRTYGTILGGHARIEDWNKYRLQLENVYSLYEQLEKHNANVKQRDGPFSSELSNIPYTHLIRIFGRARQFQRMFDVFNGMPSEGGLAPNAYTFTALLDGISRRRQPPLPLSSSGSGEDQRKANQLLYNELMYKNASDTRLIWRQLLRASTKGSRFDVDSYAIRAVLEILSRGRPSDQTFAFEIIHDYLGLSKPGQQAIPSKVALHRATLETILHMCNNAKRYSLTLHYVQQVIDSDDSESESGMGNGFGLHHLLNTRYILDTRHMNLALEARAALASLGTSGEPKQALETLEWMLRMQATPYAPGKDGGLGPQIIPDATTYNLVLLACWGGADWKSACRTFFLMTGYDAEQFRGEMRRPPKQQQRSAGRALVPSAAFMSYMIRTATKTHQKKTANMQQAINIFEHYGWDTFFRLNPTAQGLPNGASRRQEKDWVFYSAKLARVLAYVLRVLLELPDYDKPTKVRWEALRRRANDRANSGRPSGNEPQYPSAHQEALSGASVEEVYETVAHRETETLREEETETYPQRTGAAGPDAAQHLGAGFITV